jgi:mono/diheme cytochrome c family protein
MIGMATAVLTAALGSSCSRVGSPDTAAPTPRPAPFGIGSPQAPPPPSLDDRQVARGERLYGQYCASCHRPDLAGDPEWKTPNPDGSHPPPPHDSSGHTWHHSDRLLLEVVRDGSDFSQSRMPAFGGVLSDEEILAILEYFKANWGPEQRDFQWQVTWQELQRQE